MSTENPIKLYDFLSSPNCQRVKVVLEEKKLPYETIPVDLRKKEQKKPEFLKLNPNGKVPVIIDGETVLYESRIINDGGRLQIFKERIITALSSEQKKEWEDAAARAKADRSLFHAEPYHCVVGTKP